MVRRLDCNPAGQEHSYCVTLYKKQKNMLENAIKCFDDCLREYISKGDQIEYKNRMFIVHTDDNTYYFCLEAYCKNASDGGYMEEGCPKPYLLHRMGVEQAVRRVKKYGYQYWKQTKGHFYSEDALEEIRKRMTDSELAEQYPNHADRFIASYNMMKKRCKKDPNFVKGIL